MVIANPIQGNSATALAAMDVWVWMLTILATVLVVAVNAMYIYAKFWMFEKPETLLGNAASDASDLRDIQPVGAPHTDVNMNKQHTANTSIQSMESAAHGSNSKNNNNININNKNKDAISIDVELNSAM